MPNFPILPPIFQTHTIAPDHPQNAPNRPALPFNRISHRPPAPQNTPIRIIHPPAPTKQLTIYIPPRIIQTMPGNPCINPLTTRKEPVMKQSIHHAREVAEALKQVLITEANEATKTYPQYRGHFDNTLLVRFNANVEEFGFKDGDFALAEPRVMQFADRRQAIPVWQRTKYAFASIVYLRNITAAYVPLEAVEFVLPHPVLTLTLDY